MKPRRCPSCGAPLPAAQDGAVTCAFCGQAFDPTVRQAPRVVVHVSPRARRVAATTVLALVLGAVAIVLVGAGVSVWLALRGAREGLAHLPALPRAYTPERLAELPAVGRHTLQLAPPPGGYAAFDPVAALPWALSAAQGWSRDVLLERIDVERVRPDGTVNLADDGEARVRYRWLSPGRLDELARLADLDARVERPYGLFVELQRGGASVQVQAGRPPRVERPPFPAIPPLRATLTGLADRREFPQRPFYSGYLTHLPREGWVWYFQTLSGSESIPRVRARDARPYPYGR